MSNLIWFAIGILVGCYLPIIIGQLMMWDERRQLRGRKARRLTLDEILGEVLGTDQQVPAARHRTTDEDTDRITVVVPQPRRTTAQVQPARKGMDH